MKVKLLKNEEDILFYAWTLTLFLFFSQTWCPTEVVSSWSNAYYCGLLSNDRCLLAALEHGVLPDCYDEEEKYIVFLFLTGEQGRDIFNTVEWDKKLDAQRNQTEEDDIMVKKLFKRLKNTACQRRI